MFGYPVYVLDKSIGETVNEEFLAGGMGVQRGTDGIWECLTKDNTLEGWDKIIV